MKRFSTCVLVLILFVSVYIFCICAYTFISGLDDDTHAEKKFYPTYESFSRVRRAVMGNNDTWKSNVSFNVCCAPNEYLNLKLECVKVNDTADYKGLIFSESAVVDEDLVQSPMNLDRVLMDHHLGEMCSRDEMIVITWSQGETYSHYISQRNGYLLEISDDGKNVVSNYSTSSFCLDAMIGPENTKIYVALLCPCQEKVCIKKCCPKSFYFNTVNSTCQKEIEDGIESYRPGFPDNISYHLLYSKLPDCNHSDRVNNTLNKTLIFSLLEKYELRSTGMLNKKQYCLDKFSDGKNHSSFESGFYCPNEPQPPTDKESLPLIDKEPPPPIEIEPSPLTDKEPQPMTEKYYIRTISNSDTQHFINLELFLVLYVLVYFV